MDNKRVHIGVIGCTDHSKTTFKYAVSLVEERRDVNSTSKDYDITKIRFEEYNPKEEKLKVKKKKYNVKK